MAIYRSVQISFWTDNRIVDDFTPEDKYFYLYLFTNPQTNLCGCYEVSLNTMSNQLGYTKDSIERLIERFEHHHRLIKYSKQTKELLIVNWSKYNWQGGNQEKCLLKEISLVKNLEFRQFLLNVFESRFGETKGLISPLQATVSVTDNLLVNSKEIDINTNNIITNSKKNVKHKYGEYQHVRLTDDEYQQLLDDWGEGKLKKCIQILDEYIEVSGKSYKNYSIVLKKWVQDEFKKRYPCYEPNDVKINRPSAEELRKQIMGES